jgi:hypothetical protein
MRSPAADGFEGSHGNSAVMRSVSGGAVATESTSPRTQRRAARRRADSIAIARGRMHAHEHHETTDAPAHAGGTPNEYVTAPAPVNQPSPAVFTSRRGGATFRDDDDDDARYGQRRRVVDSIYVMQNRNSASSARESGLGGEGGASQSDTAPPASAPPPPYQNAPFSPASDGFSGGHGSDSDHYGGGAGSIANAMDTITLRNQRAATAQREGVASRDGRSDEGASVPSQPPAIFTSLRGGATFRDDDDGYRSAHAGVSVSVSSADVTSTRHDTSASRAADVSDAAHIRNAPISPAADGFENGHGDKSKPRPLPRNAQPASAVGGGGIDTGYEDDDSGCGDGARVPLGQRADKAPARLDPFARGGGAIGATGASPPHASPTQGSDPFSRPVIRGVTASGLDAALPAARSSPTPPSDPFARRVAVATAGSGGDDNNNDGALVNPRPQQAPSNPSRSRVSITRCNDDDDTRAQETSSSQPTPKPSSRKAPTSPAADVLENGYGDESHVPAPHSAQTTSTTSADGVADEGHSSADSSSTTPLRSILRVRGGGGESGDVRGSGDSGVVVGGGDVPQKYFTPEDRVPGWGYEYVFSFPSFGFVFISCVLSLCHTTQASKSKRASNTSAPASVYAHTRAHTHIHTHTLTHSLTHSHTHTHTHTHTHRYVTNNCTIAPDDVLHNTRVNSVQMEDRWDILSNRIASFDDDTVSRAGTSTPHTTTLRPSRLQFSNVLWKAKEFFSLHPAE